MTAKTVLRAAKASLKTALSPSSGGRLAALAVQAGLTRSAQQNLKKRKIEVRTKREDSIVSCSIVIAFAENGPLSSVCLE